MTEFLFTIGAAAWLGILTAISPCPLATNIAAISYLTRNSGKARSVFVAGLLYTLGRMFTYILLGVVLYYSFLSIPNVSQFLQKYINLFIGPVLILAGMLLLELISYTTKNSGIAGKMQGKIDSIGGWGAPLLGIIFALSFCPVSAALFFGSLLPLTIKENSPFILPAVYGLTTGIPVLIFSVIISVSINNLAKVYNKIQFFEKYARSITGVVFIMVGIYYSLNLIFGINF